MDEEEESRKFAKWSENLSGFLEFLCELYFLSHESFSVFFFSQVEECFLPAKIVVQLRVFFISWVWANISGHNVAFNTDVRGVDCWVGRGGAGGGGGNPLLYARCLFLLLL